MIFIIGFDATMINQYQDDINNIIERIKVSYSRYCKLKFVKADNRKSTASAHVILTLNKNHGQGTIPPILLWKPTSIWKNNESIIQQIRQHRSEAPDTIFYFDYDDTLARARPSLELNHELLTIYLTLRNKIILTSRTDSFAIKKAIEDIISHYSNQEDPISLSIPPTKTQGNETITPNDFRALAEKISSFKLLKPGEEKLHKILDENFLNLKIIQSHPRISTIFSEFNLPTPVIIYTNDALVMLLSQQTSLAISRKYRYLKQAESNDKNSNQRRVLIDDNHTHLNDINRDSGVTRKKAHRRLFAIDCQSRPIKRTESEVILGDLISHHIFKSESASHGEEFFTSNTQSTESHSLALG